jgi:ATP-dependent DNA helicase RecG
MLTLTDIKKLLSAGAGLRIEMLAPNVANADRMARSLTALANTRGGVLLVPLKPQRKEKVKEVDSEGLRDEAMKALLMCEPRLIVPLPYLVSDSDGESHIALVIEVPEGLPNAYSYEGRYYLRDGARNAIIAARPLRELMLLRGEGTWESSSPSGSSKEDLNWKAIEDYASKLNGAIALGEDSAEALMLTRGCVVGSRKLKPTYAGLLLFGKQPQRWIKGAQVLAARFKGSEMEDAFARQAIGGTLPEQIRKAEAFLIENMSVQSNMKSWQRSDEAPYPASALREAVVNAVAHRDYRLTGSQIHVFMFADRVEVKSPGKLPGHVTLKNLLRERYSRNEALVQVLSDMGFIERLGYGIDRMLRVMKERNQPEPNFEETDGGFIVSLFAKKGASEKLQEALPQNAQQLRLQKMIVFLKEHGRITNRDYQEISPDVNPETLRRDFVDLVERGVVMRVGDKRGTYYILK